VRVAARLPAEVPRVRADRDRITQVVVNLLSNAVKFSAPGRGRVEVVLAQDAGFVRVDVRDNGIGIAPEHHAAVFERFSQAGAAPDGRADVRPQGSGLGLHISRRIVEHFGGRMWLESAPGQGACFSFALPLAHGDAMPEAA
jgi:signal transduction histidine kinase